MKKMSLALACAAFGIAGSVHAASSASATIGDLTFQLTDLDLNDGIDASFTYTPTPWSSPGLSAFLGAKASETEAGMTKSASETSSVTSDRMTVTTVGLAHAQASATALPGGFAASGSADGAGASFSALASYVSPYSGVISLSANASLVVTAHGAVNAAAYIGDTGASDFSSAHAGFGLAYSYVTDKGLVYYSYSDSLVADAIAYSEDHSYFQYDPQLGKDVLVVIPAGDQIKTLSRSLTGVFSNTSSQTQNATVSLDAWVNGLGSAAFPVGAVPEVNGSMAGLLGLGMMGWAVRRRRAD